MNTNFKTNFIGSSVTDEMEETELIGEKIGHLLKPGQVVALMGELGAGKTCITRGIARGVGVSSNEKVNSPTFVIMQRYSGKMTVYHADVYRMETSEDLFNLDLFEMAEEGILIIEWADKFIDDMPEKTIFVELKYLSESKREIAVFSNSKNIQSLKF
ncbi:MAG: tRNA (adenosine(37)-N6)-threonylcarbamoyltransferase complex ATPase subunit type 1 TsaE [Planctomycetota bacterium]|nr:MAG: tRNA (adenosine(37)-N6)-threonylcarbamoyltransferase complex ATPase subunit type 1 TsaE [Planctomycetota bacterium]